MGMQEEITREKKKSTLTDVGLVPEYTPGVRRRTTAVHTNDYQKSVNLTHSD